MQNQKYSLLTSLMLFILVLQACSGRFVRREELQSLDEKYSGVYVLKSEADIGNNQQISKGARLRLYFISTGEALKVYAYPESQSREEAIGKNIIILFKEDFEGDNYDREQLEKRLADLLQPVK